MDCSLESSGGPSSVVADREDVPGPSETHTSKMPKYCCDALQRCCVVKVEDWVKSKCSGAWRSLMPGDGGCEQGEAPFTAHPTVSIAVELMVSLLGYSDS